MSRQTSPADYDALAYRGTADASMHFNRAAAVAQILGFQTPAVPTARVLDVGCATGGHLVPMACQFPHATFLGIDYSPRQIQAATQFAAAAGTTNISFQTRDLRDHANLGQFDYIIAHGIYSWVPPDVQQALLQLCREHLSPTGLALVDFNVYPGWRIKQILRDMIDLDPQLDLRQAVHSSRQILDFVADNLFVPASPYGQAVTQLKHWAAQQPEHYLAHEFAAAVNEPVRYTQFTAQLHNAGLQTLGDIQLPTTIPGGPNVAAQLDALAAGNPDKREQLLDFLRGREFRRALVVRSPAAEPQGPRWQNLQALCFTTLAEPQATGPGPMQYRCPDGSGLRTDSPPLRACMDALCTAWPRSLNFPQLMAAMNAPPQPVGELLLQLLTAGILQPHSAPVQVAATLPDRPRANGAARAEAASGAPAVTTLWHHAWAIDPTMRQVIQLLDGSRDLPALLAALQTQGINPAQAHQALTWCTRIALLEAPATP